MANKNIQMKHKQGSTWDNLFPLTLIENLYDSQGEQEIIKARNGSTNLNSRLNKDFGNLDTKITNEVGEVSDQVKKSERVNLGPLRYIAHRGAVQMAPENSLPAVEKTGELGYWGVEVDCRLTSDKVWMLFHDDTLDRLTNGTGNFSSRTFSQIRALRIDSGAGVWAYPELKVATLEEALDVIAERQMYATLDLKGVLTSANFQVLLDLVESKGLMDKVMLSVLNINYLDTIRNLHPTVKIEYATNSITTSIYNKLESIGNCVLSVQHGYITRNIVSNCHDRNILVSVYTANNYNTINELKRIGVNMLYTDVAISGGK